MSFLGGVLKFASNLCKFEESFATLIYPKLVNLPFLQWGLRSHDYVGTPKRSGVSILRPNLIRWMNGVWRIQIIAIYARTTVQIQCEGPIEFFAKLAELFCCEISTFLKTVRSRCLFLFLKKNANKTIRNERVKKNL